MILEPNETKSRVETFSLPKPDTQGSFTLPPYYYYHAIATDTLVPIFNTSASIDNDFTAHRSTPTPISIQNQYHPTFDSEQTERSK